MSFVIKHNFTIYLQSNSFPERNTIYDFCFFKKASGQWGEWMDLIDREKLTVPANANVRFQVFQSNTFSIGILKGDMKIEWCDCLWITVVKLNRTCYRHHYPYFLYVIQLPIWLMSFILIVVFNTFIGTSKFVINEII